MTTNSVGLRGRLEALEHNLHEHVAFVQRQVHGMYVHDRDGLLLVDSGLTTETFNRICRARFTDADAAERIHEAASYFQRVERPFTWWVGPLSQPPDLRSRLESVGLQKTATELGMAASIESAVEPHSSNDLAIRRVTTRDELLDFAGVLAAISDPPDASVIAFFGHAADVLLRDNCPMQLFVGYVDDTPAATSELFLGGGVAGLHMVSTRREFQRRGYGHAMVAAALSAGRAAGMSEAVLLASTEARSLYERLGFSGCCEFVEYAY